VSLGMTALRLGGLWQFSEKDADLTSWKVRFLNCWIHTLCPKETDNTAITLPETGRSCSEANDTSQPIDLLRSSHRVQLGQRTINHTNLDAIAFFWRKCLS
jgi:hypothetical protein